MTYRVHIKRSAEKEMRDLPDHVLRRVHQGITALAANPYRQGVRKLAGGLGFRIRVGDYRIIFSVDEAQRVIEVTAIRHRREAYR